MVKIYGIKVSSLKDPLYNKQIMEGLSQSRKEKVLKFAKEENRKQSFGAGLILKEVLPLYDDCEENVLTTKKGKPYSKNVSFSLSHSGEYALGAFSQKEVGCDVEKIDRATFKIADRFFCNSEVKYLQQFNDERKNEEFFRLWTCKESYMKMQGEGLSLPLNSFEISLENDLAVLVNGEKQKCSLKEYNLDGYKVSVCAFEKDFTKEIVFL